MASEVRAKSACQCGCLFVGNYRDVYLACLEHGLLQINMEAQKSPAKTTLQSVRVYMGSDVDGVKLDGAGLRNRPL